MRFWRGTLTSSNFGGPQAKLKVFYQPELLTSAAVFGQRDPVQERLSMEICLFIFATASVVSTADPKGYCGLDFNAVEALAASMPDLRGLILHVPVESETKDPYLRSEATPRCAMQFYFDELGAMEATLKTNGAAHALFDKRRFPALADCILTHQAMAVRRFPVLEAQGGEPFSSRCTYLVSYEGEAEDLNRWLGHYIDNHPPIMARFPGIREIEVYTRLDYRGTLPAVRSIAMQRNKVVFDSPEALNLALASPIRRELRDDFKLFPPFTGNNSHYAMISRGRRSTRFPTAISQSA
jgi:hypothetical protein